MRLFFSTGLKDLETRFHHVSHPHSRTSYLIPGRSDSERPEIKYDFLEWGGKRMRDSGLSRVWSIVPATQRGPRYSQRSCVQA